MALNPDIVGENTNVVEAEKAIATNSQVIVEAAREVSAVQEASKKLEAGDEAAGGAPTAKGSTEAGVYADVALDAVGGTALKLAKTAVDIVKDSDAGKHGGMNTFEDLGKGAKPKMGSGGPTKDILGKAVPRSIRGPHFNDVAGRAKLAGGFMSGEDKVKGAKANESSLAALKTTQDQQLNAQVLSKLHLGNAVQKKAHLGAVHGKQMQAGLAPGGGMQQLAKNARAPKGPSDDIFKDKHAAELADTTTDWA